MSAKDEFARHARLQRRILALERTLKSAGTSLANPATPIMSSPHAVSFSLCACLVAETHKAQQTATRQINLVLKGVIILARMLLVIFYRASIVAHLPVGMTGPLAPLLAFPTGEGASGAISGLTWILLCNTAIALIC